MKKKTVSGIMLTFLRLFVLLILGAVLSSTMPVHASVTTIYVDPPMSYASSGETFNISLRIEDAVDVFAWGVNMSFNPNVLEFQEAWEGDFLKDQPEGTSGLLMGEFVGYVYMVCSTRGNHTGVDGSGTLATAEFKAKEDVTGETIINISDPGVWNEDLGYHVGGTNILDHLEREIPRITVDGYFISTQLLPFYDQFLTLNSSYYSVLADYNDLLDDYNSLLTDYDDLLDSYDTLSTSFNTLTALHDFLAANHTNLQDSYDSLSYNHSSLQADYDSLESGYNDLQSQHDALTGDLNTATNLNYFLVVTTIVFIASTVYLAIRKSKVQQPKTT